jgi:hypothetical protein
VLRDSATSRSKLNIQQKKGFAAASGHSGDALWWRGVQAGQARFMLNWKTGLLEWNLSPDFPPSS